MVAISVVGASVFVWAGSGQLKPASATTPTVEEVLKAVRADLQSSRADLMAKNMTLTAAEAAKFWPVFDAYQKEQNVIMDEQMKGLQEYADAFERLDDA